jgi:hypothetical protein
MNWIRKQWFLFQYLIVKKHKGVDVGDLSFSSSAFNNIDWWQDDAGWNHSLFMQEYGYFRYVAILDGAFEQKSWPALWLVNWNDCYREIDIELIKTNNEFTHLEYTIWWNKLKASSKKEDGCIVKRVRINNQKLIRRLQTKYHEHVIVWKPNKIQYYINGLLVCEFKISISGQMWIVAGKATINEINVYKS